ncbi:hypothetical protein TRFO_28127 [Tritrichomonas foetus]|uniref:Uncharacterized protein n=1 Tax=Tritrichomonas foetus TaxID=1144522 RepID=A0A1J4K3R2_9EUKA|nr:hypothetical protein TRFO_28127 [Tritrichomonas foetus]|eukprot:OHT04366.1 hypothetical protein TRFO_28127 [Tritrichomonas foetus]
MKRKSDPYDVIIGNLNAMFDEVTNAFASIITYLKGINATFEVVDDKFKNIYTNLENANLSSSFTNSMKYVHDVTEYAANNLFFESYEVGISKLTADQQDYLSLINARKAVILPLLQNMSKSLIAIQKLNESTKSEGDPARFNQELINFALDFRKNSKQAKYIIDQCIQHSHNSISMIESGVDVSVSLLMGKFNIMSEPTTNIELDSIPVLRKNMEKYFDFDYIYNQFIVNTNSQNIEKVDYFMLDSSTSKKIRVSIKENCTVDDIAGEKVSLSVGDSGEAEVIGYSKFWKVNIRNTTCYVPSHVLGIL